MQTGTLSQERVIAQVACVQAGRTYHPLGDEPVGEPPARHFLQQQWAFEV